MSHYLTLEELNAIVKLIFLLLELLKLIKIREKALIGVDVDGRARLAGGYLILLFKLPKLILYKDTCLGDSTVFF
jgi:hypothetical protein